MKSLSNQAMKSPNGDVGATLSAGPALDGLGQKIFFAKIHSSGGA
jgi:hypothetical protein